MNTSNDRQISIPLSKSKITLLTLGAFAFVALGTWIWIDADTQSRYAPAVARFIGAISILFFGTIGCGSFYKLFSRKAGLIISEKGIFDNSNATSVGWIDWPDIYGIEEIEIYKARNLVVYVNNPETYFIRMNPIQKLLIKLNSGVGQGGIWINPKALACDFSKLKTLLEDAFLKYSSPPPINVP